METSAQVEKKSDAKLYEVKSEGGTSGVVFMPNFSYFRIPLRTSNKYNEQNIN